MKQLTTYDWIKIGINTIAGVLTLILQHIIPIAGGGSSLIFVLTVPFTVGFSFIATMVYLFSSNQTLKNTVIYLSIIVNLFVTFTMYPYG